MKASALLVLLCASLFAAKPINWETGHVVSQNISSETVGEHAAPYFGVGTPRTVTDSAAISTVVVDSAGIRYTWRERYVINPLILTVNDDVQFYRDKYGFVVLDAKRKVHHYSLVGLEKLKPEN